MKMDDNQVAALPSMIANQVERMICRHRKERKMMADKRPAAWQSKLEVINNQTMSMCWNRKTCSMASPWYVKKATKTVDGVLQFIVQSEKQI